MKVSIIIPIYNAEKFLRRCLDSVLKQTYQNIEVLCINDGSTDKSLDILSFYSENEKIKVFHKENGGVSSARNLGIDKSTGDFIMFIDSDDEIEPTYIEDLLKYTEKYDIIKSGYKIDGAPVEKFESNCELSFKNFFDEVKRGNRFNVVFSQLIRKNCIQHIRFREDITYGEDLLFNYECYKQASGIYVVATTGYNMITDNGESITRTVSIDKIKTRILDTFIVYNHFLDEHISEGEKNAIILKKININLKNYIRSKNASYKVFKNIISEPNIQAIFNNKNQNLSIIDKKNKILIFLLQKKLFRLYFLIIKIKRS